MCEVLDRIENRGFERGIKKIILNLSEYFSIAEISKYLQMPIEEIQSILQSN